MPTIGCDLVQIDRIQNVQGIAKRLLSPKEYSQFQELHGQRQKEFLAGPLCGQRSHCQSIADTGSVFRN